MDLAALIANASKAALVKGTSDEHHGHMTKKEPFSFVPYAKGEGARPKIQIMTHTEIRIQTIPP